MMNVDTSPVILSHALASVFQRLAQFAKSTSWGLWAEEGLTPTQRSILDLLARNNSGLRLSAIARQLGVTASTACDSKKALSDKELICKGRSGSDGRALSVMLTAKGKDFASLLASQPDPLIGVFEPLEEPELETLYRFSIKMIRGLQELGALAPSRMCVYCKFFEPFKSSPAPTPHFCQRIGASLGDAQIRMDCEVFEPTDQREALWVRFVSPPAEPGRDSAADCGGSVNTSLTLTGIDPPCAHET
jgi:DNA-binding MarR family transcriptional regulator